MQCGIPVLASQAMRAGANKRKIYSWYNFFPSGRGLNVQSFKETTGDAHDDNGESEDHDDQSDPYIEVNTSTMTTAIKIALL